MQFTTLALSALLGLVSAQKTSVTVVKVSTANNSLTFLPDNLKVTPGSMVQFQFMAGNHTVTQSTFDQPCQPIGKSTNVTGFHSGYVPVAASAGNVPTYTIMVNNTTPLWIYCAQAKHCQNGMTMVINENTAANQTRSLAGYRSLASKASSSGSSSTGSTGSTGSSGDTSAAGSTSSTTSSASASSSTAATATGAGSLLAIPDFAVSLVAVAGSFLLL